MLVFATAMMLGACGVNLGIEGVTSEWVTIDGQNGRKALLVAPENHDPATSTTKLPLVVNLHGLGSNAEDMARLAEWPQAVVDDNLLMVFPDGRDKSWNAGGCCGGAVADGIEDVSYLDFVIDQMVAEEGADPDQIYMTGYSNGAMMTYRYNCERPDKLKGAASYAGTNYSDCVPTGSSPFFQISGSADPVIPVLGGESTLPGVGDVPKVETSMEEVSTGANCAAPEFNDAEGVAHFTAVDCRDNSAMRFDVVEGLDHHYPTAETWPSYVAVTEILDFWGLSSRPAEGVEAP